MAKRDRLNSLNIERREFHDKVINFFNTQDEAPFNYKQVSAQVGAKTPKQRALIVEILEQLSVDGFINEIAPGKFRAVRAKDIHRARVTVAPGVTHCEGNARLAQGISHPRAGA